MRREFDAKLAVTVKAVIVLGLICISSLLIYHLAVDFQSTVLICLGIAVAPPVALKVPAKPGGRQVTCDGRHLMARLLPSQWRGLRHQQREF